MKYKIFLLIFLVSLISSIILSTNGTTGVCKPGAGCDLVNNSSYGSTLGIKNSVYGIFIFSFMVLVTLFHITKPNKHTRMVIHTATIIGSLIAIYFLYLQIFIIKYFCEFCLLIDLGLLVSLVFMFWLWEH